MFLAVILACTTADPTSCEIFSNTEQVFVTEAACQADLEKAFVELSSLPLYMVKPGCISLPGQSA